MRVSHKIIATLAAFLLGSMSSAQADTLTGALAKAYLNNPTLNAARANLRATDEAVPQAKANLRPSVSGSIISQHTFNRSRNGPSLFSAGGTTRTYNSSNTYGVTATQTAFAGFQNRNAILGAKSSVLSGRQSLIDTEQQVLLGAVTAFMDVVQTQALVDVNRQNVEVLSEQLRSTRDRFEVGEVTRTDVAQADSRLSEGIGNLRTAEGNLETARAIYEQIVGNRPGILSFPSLGFNIPATLATAIDTGLFQHPSIRAAKHDVETAEFAIKQAMGQFSPTLTFQASASRAFDPTSTVGRSDDASFTSTLSIPLYQQGAVSSQVREAKANRTTAQLNLDVARRQIRADVRSSWATLNAAKGEILADVAQIKAAELALEGVREEERVGQRTTLDVLDAQQEVLTARSNLIQSQRDRIVAAYTLASSTGRLTASKLGLGVDLYDPKINFDRVKNKWFGIRTGQGN